MHAHLRTEVDRLADQLTRGQCRVGRGAVREIARRITEEHGFWDFDERKAAHRSQAAQSAEVVPVAGGEDPHRFLAGRLTSGEEPPELIT